MDINVNYPSELSPGEDRYFKRGLEVVGFTGKLRVEFFVTGIDIKSTKSDTSGAILMECKHGAVTTQPLFYHAHEDLVPPLRKEIGIKVSRKKLSFFRIASLVGLILLVALPQIAIMFRSGFFSVSLTTEQSILVSIPGYLILGVLLTVNRIRSLLTTILSYEVEVDVSESSHGIHDIIHIKERAGYLSDNMKIRTNT